MKILLISQVFWPDTASTAQHLSDLADVLVKHHEVRVITSRHNYENPKITYPRREEKNGIVIRRINNTGFGKRNVFSRTFDFLSFNLLLFFRLFSVNTKNTDLILGMTSPPLISFIGVWFAKIKGISFQYWTMDLQPELSISTGLIKKNSLAAKVFQRMGNYIFRRADRIIALDKYMADYIVARGVSEEKISVVPVWPVLDQVYTGTRLENPFRVENGFGSRIVVMYSGNHSVIHPLDTLLEAALLLRDDDRFLFVFVGGGVRKKDVTAFKRKHALESIVQLEYQPRSKIHFSLGSADLQVVILGENQVGFTHPNKIYGSMFAGKPILYIGPTRSHITDIISDDSGNVKVCHGRSGELVTKMQDFASGGPEHWEAVGSRNRDIACRLFHPDILKNRMCNIVSGSYIE